MKTSIGQQDVPPLSCETDIPKQREAGHPFGYPAS